MATFQIQKKISNLNLQFDVNFNLLFNINCNLCSIINLRVNINMSAKDYEPCIDFVKAFNSDKDQRI